MSDVNARVLVTGGSGFVGGALLRRLSRDGYERVTATVRGPGGAPVAGAAQAVVAELGPDTDWSAVVAGIDVVVHAAARVHVMREVALDPLAEFRRVNVAGTLALARCAADAGVRRFVFLSSIKVNGESTDPGRPFRADDSVSPTDPYGVSKYEAEQGLVELSRATGMEVVIIRPVLVYGPAVKGNFLTMMKWVSWGVPLPFGRIHNARSLVALDNLVDLIVVCLDHPAAAGARLLVSDGHDLSTTALLTRMAEALHRSARLVPVPASALTSAAVLLGKGDLARRLCGSLQVDIEPTRRSLFWSPPVRFEDALTQTAQHFLDTHHA